MKDSFAYIVTHLSRSFSAYCNTQLQQQGLSLSLLYYILYLHNHPGCTPGQLSTALGQDTGYTTRCLDKLIQSGFAQREKSTQDRRVWVLHLPPQGEAIFRTSHDLFGQWDNEILTPLSPDERTQLIGLLGRLFTQKGE